MSVKQVCSLCRSTCSEYKSLQTSLDECNDIYNITVKYFNPMLLTENEYINSHHEQVLCRDCWFYINKFHLFQQKVFKSRMPWEDKSTLTTFLIEVKQEEVIQQNVPTLKISDNGSLDKNEHDEDNTFENSENDLITESLSSCRNTVESILEQEVIQTNVPTSNTSDNGSFENSEDDEDDLFEYNLEYGDLKTEFRTSSEDTLEPILKQTDEKDEDNSLALEEGKNDDEHNSTTATKWKIRQRTNSINDTKSCERIITEDTKRAAKTNMERGRESDAIIARWQSELICDLCSETATNFEQLRSHFKEKHKTTKLYVKCCERKFYRRYELLNHVQLHLNPESFKCDICGKSSTTKRILGLHKKVMHENRKQLKCYICDILFKQKDTLKRHMLTHSISSKDFNCPECGKGCVTEQLLESHIKHDHEDTKKSKRIMESDAFIAEWKAELICDLCSEAAPNLGKLRSHFKEKHKKKFYIKCCERKFYHRWILVEHIQLHLNPDTFKCDICRKSYTTKRLLGLHKNAAHQGLNKSERITHSDALISEWKPELTCEVCSETATNYGNLRRHFKEKHTETEFYIKCCERKFYQRRFLVQHIQLHVNPDALKCDICGKTSSSKRHLVIHKKTVHEKTKQFKCNVCEKRFNQKASLNKHNLTHSTSSKDFICSECGKGYVNERLLKYHIKYVHGDDHVCDQCGKTIHGSQALKIHLMKHAGIERPNFPCDVCGIKLKTAYGLRRHKSVYHNDDSTIYICGVCGKVLANEFSLLSHKRIVHATERKHKCTYCDKTFSRPISLKEHIATHTGEDLYQCPHCPQKFKVNSRMHHHRKRKHPVEWEEARKKRPQCVKTNNNQVKKHIAIY